MSWTREKLRKALAPHDTSVYTFANYNKAYPECRTAAVLVPLFIRDGDVHVLLTLRASHMREHGGDVAFPGGKREPQDRDEVDTCLRESEEEIQLPRDQVEIIARIPGTVTRFGDYVAPVIGIIPDDFQGVPSDEVEVIFTVPLRRFLTKDGYRFIHWKTFRVHFFQDDIDGQKIETWGLTAKICVEVAVALYREVPHFKLSYIVDVDDPFQDQKLTLRKNFPLLHKL